MRTWILLTGMLLMGLFVAVYGALMLTSPSKWADFIDRASFADRWSFRAVPQSRGNGIQIRIVGIIMTVMGGFFAYAGIRGLIAMLYGKHLEYHAPASASAGRVPHHTWFDLGVPTAAGLLGIYILLFPDSFLQWMAGKMRPSREIKQEALPYLRVLVRVMAVIALYGGISGVYTWLRAML
jgi:hypothetical protein